MFRYVHIIAQNAIKLIAFYKTVFRSKSINEEREHGWIDLPD